jgi:hypothetical protein
MAKGVSLFARQPAEGEIAPIRRQLMQQCVDHAQASEPQRRVIMRLGALKNLPRGVEKQVVVWLSHRSKDRTQALVGTTLRQCVNFDVISSACSRARADGIRLAPFERGDVVPRPVQGDQRHHAGRNGLQEAGRPRPSRDSIKVKNRVADDEPGQRGVLLNGKPSCRGLGFVPMCRAARMRPTRSLTGSRMPLLPHAGFTITYPAMTESAHRRDRIVGFLSSYRSRSATSTTFGMRRSRSRWRKAPAWQFLWMPMEYTVLRRSLGAVRTRC